MDRLRDALGRPHPERVAIVAAALAARRPARYLEIGVHTGVVFLHVRAASKVGVDPEPRVPTWKRALHPNTLLHGRIVRAPSDAYFAALDPAERFDVVFVDGDHSLAQARRDIDSALAHLADGGTVLVHDCDPPSAAAASPDPADAGGGPWCGEAWKAVAELRATRRDLTIGVIATDCGVGVVERRPSALSGVDPASIEAMGFADLAADRQRLLGIIAAPRG